MPSVDRKWLPMLLIGLAIVASLLAYARLPEMVDLRLERLLPFDTAEPASLVPRWLALSGVPLLALLLWAAFRAAPTAAGQRVGRRLLGGAPEAVTSPEQFARFRKSYDVIVLAVVVLLVGLHAAILAGALGYPGIAVRTIPAVLGACLVMMGNVMPRLRPNWVAGVRTRRTFEDPQLWRATHRAFGTAFVVSGFVTIVVALAAPRYGLLVGIASLIVSLLVGLVASTRSRETVRS
jgi:SdpI/YfhL protein family